MSAQDRHNSPPAPSEHEYEALTADAELGRKRGEWLTEAYARISELEIENRRVREALVMIYRESPAAVARVCDEFLDRSGRLLGEIRQEARRG